MSPALCIPSGVLRDFAPLPPLRYNPCSSGLIDCFRAPSVVVVVPEGASQSLIRRKMTETSMDLIFYLKTREVRIHQE